MFKYLTILIKILSYKQPINGYTNEDAARKKRFERCGKEAMKEVAQFLDLVEYNISFNMAGIACSGELTLMGMGRDGKGIYIHIDHDSVLTGLGVLYREIKHMKDYQGGQNYWLPLSDLCDLEVLKRKIESMHICEDGQKRLYKKQPPEQNERMLFVFVKTFGGGIVEGVELFWNMDEAERAFKEWTEHDYPKNDEEWEEIPESCRDSRIFNTDLPECPVTQQVASGK